MGAAALWKKTPRRPDGMNRVQRRGSPARDSTAWCSRSLNAFLSLPQRGGLIAAPGNARGSRIHKVFCALKGRLNRDAPDR